MSFRPEFLKFGYPSSLNQMVLRLPTRQCAEYHTNYTFEHAAHFREWLIDMASSHPLLQPLECRLAPLEPADINLMGEFGIHRQPAILTSQWAALSPDSYFADCLPSDDNEYRWWQICPLVPRAQIRGAKFFAIETNSHYQIENSTFRFDSRSEFEIALLFPIEIDHLIQELKPRTA